MKPRTFLLLAGTVGETKPSVRVFKGIPFAAPPLGENLFVASGIGGASIEEISYRALPFAAASIIALFIIAYVPQISLWLPGVMGY